jgi:GNAT superfamily N-acetyltransferase
MTAPATIRRLDADDLGARLEALGAILSACVHGGASVNFVVPFTPRDGAAWWERRILPGVAAGTVVLLAAFEDGDPVATVALNMDTPPNQRHRADVTKLLVHPGARRRGIARALMTAIEAEARERGLSLLTLDTVSGSDAERLYAGLGWQTAGVIPDYAVDPLGGPRRDPSTFMYKRLSPAD